MKNVEYMIIKSDNVEMLVKLVNEKLKIGWRPCGGVTVETNPHFAPALYQSLIRESLNN